MKKIISLLLASAMVLALILATVLSVSASIEGNWNVYGRKSAYASEEKLNETSIPGYEYSADGLHMIPANWSNSTPWGIVQTKEQIDLRQGVYMEVRVDDFTYSGDKWFGFNVWEERIDEFPHEEDKQAIGYEALIRLNEKNIGFFQLNWHESPGVTSGTSSVDAINVKDEFDDNGCAIYKFYITWNEETGYNVSINGADLGAAFNKRFTDFFDGPENDGKAYISFSLQNGTKGGTVECTVLKFGTSPEKCEKPMGDDSAKPINNNVDFAPIADPSTVPEGEPAVRLNGSRENSDLHRMPGSTNNCLLTVNDDDSLSVSTTTNWASVSMSVTPEVSYDIDDFPIMLMITRNFCTCEWTDGFSYCQCKETPTVITMAGDVIAEDSKNQVLLLSHEFEAFWGGDDNMYLYYTADWSEYSGRINGFRMDVHNVRYTEEGRNSFDICEVGFFRNIDEAKEYFMDYLALTEDDEETETDPDTTLDTEPETDPETESEVPTDDVATLPIETTATESESAEVSESESETAAESVSSTDEMTEENTEKTTEGSTSAQESETSVSQSSETSTVTETEPDETEKQDTEKITEKQTEIPTEKATDTGKIETDGEEKSGGCGSAVGVGSVALVTVIAGAIAFLGKRKE